MKNHKEKPTNGQVLAGLPYVLLEVKERIQDGSFFELSNQAQSLLHVLAASVYSTREGLCCYQRELMAAQASVDVDRMGKTLDELIASGLAAKREWSHKGDKILELPIKKEGMFNNSEKFVYLDSRMVTNFLWGSFPVYSRSVYWLLKGHAVPGCKADMLFTDDRQEYQRRVIESRFEIVPEVLIDRFGVDEKPGHAVIKKSRWNYTRGLSELRNSKIVYDYAGKYLNGIAIKKINLL